jgi:hypothetical protein
MATGARLAFPGGRANSWVGLWRAPDGRRVKRRIGTARTPGERDGLTKVQAEDAFRRLRAEELLVAHRLERVTMLEAGEALSARLTGRGRKKSHRCDSPPCPTRSVVLRERRGPRVLPPGNWPPARSLEAHSPVQASTGARRRPRNHVPRTAAHIWNADGSRRHAGSGLSSTGSAMPTQRRLRSTLTTNRTTKRPTQWTVPSADRAAVPAPAQGRVYLRSSRKSGGAPTMNACHAEGRGFESLQPLPNRPAKAGLASVRIRVCNEHLPKPSPQRALQIPLPRREAIARSCPRDSGVILLRTTRIAGAGRSARALVDGHDHGSRRLSQQYLPSRRLHARSRRTTIRHSHLP